MKLFAFMFCTLLGFTLHAQEGESYGDITNFFVGLVLDNPKMFLVVVILFLIPVALRGGVYAYNVYREYKGQKRLEYFKQGSIPSKVFKFSKELLLILLNIKTKGKIGDKK